ncbi:MAG TPA: neuraminidase-like domain-containing protein, partial [Trichocoleus sp.]
GFVDAAFVDTENRQTYLFSGEQYIRYSGDRYRYIDEGYPKLIAESLAQELGLEHLNEIYRDGIDAALYLSNLGLVLFNERRYLNVITTGDRTGSRSTEGDINQVWGHLDNVFAAASPTIDGAYVDTEGALQVFKGQQVVRYSDTATLFALNPYDEARYVDTEYPRYIRDIWPQLDAAILTANGIDSVFQFEDEIYFHTGGDFVTYQLDLSDRNERQPVQVLSYRWGQWSDYLLSDIHAISHFKALGQQFTGGELTLSELVSGAKGAVAEPYMHFAAIFGFEKQEVRWVKQRNAFLPGRVNDLEEDFQLELVLRLYDILATTQRLRVDVSALYQKVWLPLYGDNARDLKAAAQGAYDVLVAIDCDNNYATLVKQITDEINTLKRDALVPYVIAHDSEVNTTRQLYQKLLIDIQMASQAETSRIQEATAAVQLYLHRYFINLEDIALDASDQQATRTALKERWQWLRSYRVWEANRKVFLYPENYIRPELRDTKTAGFKALEESLSQGELTPDKVEEAYLKYLDSFTEVSELTIAGGYVYDDASSGTADKKLVLFGRTRTSPIRYFYRFGSFVSGDSAAATWEPWEALDISIEATRVEPVFAFNRVFVFWTVLKRSADNPSSAVVTTRETSEGQVVSAASSSEEEIQVYYSFYNLNKRWSQPQPLQTTFNGVTTLKYSQQIFNVDVFVENSTKLKQDRAEQRAEHDYENIYISVRFDLSAPPSTAPNPQYKAFNLTPELYSQIADKQTIENRGQALFKALFPNEFSDNTPIEDANVVKLNYSANSMDGPWFAYNHNGSGFLVKPDAKALASNIQLTPLSEIPGLPNRGITAAVQVFAGGDVYYFLDDQNYLTYSVDGARISGPDPINSRWGIDDTSVMQTSGNVDSAFVINGSSYLTLNAQVYEYDGASFATLIKEPYALSKLIEALPSSWKAIDAAFTDANGVSFWFNNASGSVLRSDTGQITSTRTRFGLAADGPRLESSLTAAAAFNGAFYAVRLRDRTYTTYTATGSTLSGDPRVKSVLEAIFGR